jgi:hypothetical protein
LVARRTVWTRIDGPLAFVVAALNRGLALGALRLLAVRVGRIGRLVRVQLQRHGAGNLAHARGQFDIGEVGRGILRSPEESVLDGMVYVTDYLLELPVTQWATVLEGASITVDGVGYLAREQGRINRDGSSIFVPLTPATMETFTADVFELGVFA